MGITKPHDNILSDKLGTVEQISEDLEEQKEFDIHQQQDPKLLKFINGA